MRFTIPVLYLSVCLSIYVSAKDISQNAHWKDMYFSQSVSSQFMI